VSDAVIIALIGAVSTNAMGILLFIRQGRQAGNIEKIHKATNSMKDALVRAAKSAGIVEGIKRERSKKGKGLKYGRNL